MNSIRFHDLRHTYARIKIDLGENPEYIQNQMGHASINVTFDIFGHLIETENKEAAKRHRDAIFEESGSKMVATIKKELTMKANSLKLLEAATRFELVNNGFADRCLSHLAMPPKILRLIALMRD